MLHGENYFFPWVGAEGFPESFCPRPGPCSPEGSGEIGTGVERTVSEGTHLLGVAKLEPVFGRVSIRAPSLHPGVKDQSKAIVGMVYIHRSFHV